jgi:hypothetical protein
VKNDNLEKIRFGFAEKCDINSSNSMSESLTYNMSYLASVVHPLIIIRLLEHRLFTPLLKKSTPAATRNATQSVSLSTGGAPGGGAYLISPHHPNTLQLNPVNYQHSVSVSMASPHHESSSSKITPSTSFPSNPHLLTATDGSQMMMMMNTSTKSNSPMGRASMQLGRCSNELDASGEHDVHYQRKHSQISLFSRNRYEKSYTDSLDTDNFVITKMGGGNGGGSGKSPVHLTAAATSSSSSKKTLFKDLSRRLLKSVSRSNSGGAGLKPKLNVEKVKRHSKVSAHYLGENENLCKFNSKYISMI